MRVSSGSTVVLSGRVILVACLGLCIFISAGCEDKLKKLKAKAEEVERELTQVDRKWQRWREIVDRLSREERLRPRPVQAIQEKAEAARQVRESIREEENKAGEKVDEIIKEIGRLSETELSEVLKYALENLPKLAGELEKKNQKLKSLLDLISKVSMEDKFSAMNEVMDRAERLMAQLTLRFGESTRRRLLEKLDLTLVEGAQINFFSEENALSELARLVDIQAFPVVPGSFVPRLTVFIDEFAVESPFEELSDGVLAAGTEIDIFLPPGINLMAPASFDSGFELAVEGNFAGSTHLHVEIVSGQDESIAVQFNGISIGALTCGVPLESSLSVMPGKIKKTQLLPVCSVR